MFTLNRQTQVAVLLRHYDEIEKKTESVLDKRDMFIRVITLQHVHHYTDIQRKTRKVEGKTNLNRSKRQIPWSSLPL